MTVKELINELLDSYAVCGDVPVSINHNVQEVIDVKKKFKKVECITTEVNNVRPNVNLNKVIIE